MATVVKVRSTDAMAANAVRALSWADDAGNHYGTAHLVLTDELGFRPGEDDYVEITRIDGVTREFSGIAVMPDIIDQQGERDFTRELDAVGFGKLLDRIRITATISWPADTPDSKMASDLATLYWSQISTTAVHVIRPRRVTMPPMTALIGTSLRSAFDAIAAEAWDAPYWVDSDKRLRWNDRPAAPYVLWAPAAGDALEPYDDATFAPIESPLVDHGDSASKALRVRVIGDAGVEATVTDWPGVAHVQARRADEFGAPAERYFDLPDVTDTSLTTAVQCRRRGWAELSRQGSRRTITAITPREGFAVGQVVDLANHHLGPMTVPYPRRRARVPSYSGNELHDGQGRFQIQRLQADALGGGETRYTLELGTYERPFAVALARG